jgi:hypothetical protein
MNTDSQKLAPVAAARQLLESSVDVNPATTAELWDLLARYRRALADLVAVQDLSARRSPARHSGGYAAPWTVAGKRARIDCAFIQKATILTRP